MTALANAGATVAATRARDAHRRPACRPSGSPRADRAGVPFSELAAAPGLARGGLHGAHARGALEFEPDRGSAVDRPRASGACCWPSGPSCARCAAGCVTLARRGRADRVGRGAHGARRSTAAWRGAASASLRGRCQGDGTVVARVASQDDGNPQAKAGLLLRDGDGRGSAYAAVMVTPDGVRAADQLRRRRGRQLGRRPALAQAHRARAPPSPGSSRPTAGRGAASPASRSTGCPPMSRSGRSWLPRAACRSSGSSAARASTWCSTSGTATFDGLRLGAGADPRLARLGRAERVRRPAPSTSTATTSSRRCSPG